MIVFHRIVRFFLFLVLVSTLGTQVLLAQAPPTKQRAIDSLMQVAKSAATDSVKVTACLELAQLYQQQGESVLAFRSARKAVNLSNQAGDQRLVLQSSQVLARLHYMHRQNDSVIHYFEQAVAAALVLEDSVSMARTYSNLGLLYQYSGQWEKANTSSFKGLELKERLGLPQKLVASSHDNIAIGYQELGKYESAIEHQKISLKIYTSEKDTALMSTRLHMIGGAFFKMERLDSARFYYERAFELANSINQWENISIYHMNIGLIQMKEDALGDAALSFKKSLEAFPENGDSRMLVFINSNLAEVYLKLGKAGGDLTSFRQCIDYANKTYDLAAEQSFLDQMRKSSKFLYEAHDGLGNSARAVTYARQYIALNDSLFNEQKQKAVEEIQTRYETEKKEAEIAFLDRENAIKAENLDQAKKLEENQWLIILLLALVVAGVAGLSIWIFRIYIQKSKANVSLEHKNEVISTQNEEKELLLKEIHHRVKNNLQVVSSLLDLQSMGLDSEEARVAVNDGQNRVKAMALIHEKLYQNEDITNLDFGDYAEQLVRQTKSLFPGMGKVETQIETQHIELDIDTAVPLGLILSELLTNSFKYAFPDGEGKITLSLVRVEAGKYDLVIADDGPGLPPDFDFQKAKSLGLKLVRRLSRQLYGKAEYSNDGGAQFTITFLETYRRKAAV